jgi:hypothetical protein
MGFELFIISTDNCTHCHTFRDKHREKLLSKLRTIGTLIVKEINLPTMDTKLKDYPELSKYNIWFPTFIFVSNRSTHNQEIAIFNGDISPEGKATYKLRSDLNADNVANWCESLCSKDRSSKNQSNTTIEGKSHTCMYKLRSRST